jgi:uncharacterized membrane protein (UPF0127 family)
MVHRWTFTNGFNYNRYVPGSGVGAQTISVRRHLKRFAHHHAYKMPEIMPEIVMPKTQLIVNGLSLIAEVASTKETYTRGLMFRYQLEPNHGMLFVLPAKAKYCFWMKNTYLALSIAFLSDDGTIVGLADMQPESAVKHCASEPVRYALEMEQGWFSRNNVGIGDRITNVAS